MRSLLLLAVLVPAVAAAGQRKIDVVEGWGIVRWGLSGAELVDAMRKAGLDDISAEEPPRRDPTLEVEPLTYGDGRTAATVIRFTLDGRWRGSAVVVPEAGLISLELRARLAAAGEGDRELDKLRRRLGAPDSLVREPNRVIAVWSGAKTKVTLIVTGGRAVDVTYERVAPAKPQPIIPPT
jgi:hypothetical protein